MPRDAVSRTANVERTDRHKWVKIATQWHGKLFSIKTRYLFIYNIYNYLLIINNLFFYKHTLKLVVLLLRNWHISAVILSIFYTIMKICFNYSFTSIELIVLILVNWNSFRVILSICYVITMKSFNYRFTSIKLVVLMLVNWNIFRVILSICYTRLRWKFLNFVSLVLTKSFYW